MDEVTAWLGDRWPYISGATALLIAAMTGELDAFGLTLGVLAAVQAAIGGRRVERAAERIETTVTAIQRADRLERIVQVQTAVARVIIAVKEGSLDRQRASLHAGLVTASRAARAVDRILGYRCGYLTGFLAVDPRRCSIEDVMFAAAKVLEECGQLEFQEYFAPLSP